MNSSNIGCKGGNSWNRLYGYQVNAYHGELLSKWIRVTIPPRTNDQTVHWHCLAHNLEPSPGCSAQIYATSRRFQEGVFFVQLDELECGTCTVPLFSAEYAQAVVRQIIMVRRTLRVCSTYPIDPCLFSSEPCPSRGILRGLSAV